MFEVFECRLCGACFFLFLGEWEFLQLEEIVFPFDSLSKRPKRGSTLFFLFNETELLAPEGPRRRGSFI